MERTPYTKWTNKEYYTDFFRERVCLRCNKRNVKRKSNFPKQKWESDIKFSESKKRERAHITPLFSLYLSSHLSLSSNLRVSVSVCVLFFFVFLQRRLIQLLMLISLFVLLPLIFFLLLEFPSSQHIHFRTFVVTSAYLLIFPSPNWWCIIWMETFCPYFMLLHLRFAVFRNLRTKWKIDKTFGCRLLLLQ